MTHISKSIYLDHSFRHNTLLWQGGSDRVVHSMVAREQGARFNFYKLSSLVCQRPDSSIGPHPLLPLSYWEPIKRWTHSWGQSPSHLTTSDCVFTQTPKLYFICCLGASHLIKLIVPHRRLSQPVSFHLVCGAGTVLSLLFYLSASPGWGQRYDIFSSLCLGFSKDSMQNKEHQKTEKYF